MEQLPILGYSRPKSETGSGNWTETIPDKGSFKKMKIVCDERVLSAAFLHVTVTIQIPVQ